MNRFSFSSHYSLKQAQSEELGNIFIHINKNLMIEVIENWNIVTRTRVFFKRIAIFAVSSKYYALSHVSLS